MKIKFVLLLLATMSMAALCEESKPPCIKKLHPDDAMGTYLYPEDCQESSGGANRADSGTGP